MKKQLLNRFPFILLLVKWSGIALTDGRGKVGGSVLSKSRSGATVRNKVTPVNRRSIAQQSVRALLAYFAQLYRSLTDTQRQSWINAANNGFTGTNIFGDTIKKSGIGLYVGLNINLDTVGVAPLTTAPVAADVANTFDCIPSADVSASEVFVEGATAGGSSVVPANTAWVILSTGPVSAGINFVSSQYRIVAIADAATDTATNNIFSAYTAKFGSLVAGQKVFFKITAVNKTTGQAGIPVAAYTTVVA